MVSAESPQEQAARMIDRLAPTMRPCGMAIGHQRWRDLLFVHWPVPIQAVRQRVPAPLAIDTFDGAACIGIVAFVMESLALAGSLRIFSLGFLETNVRTYVHVKGTDPGVYFFSLDAESLFAVICGASRRDRLGVNIARAGGSTGMR